MVKIVVITTTRADYGLLSSLIRALSKCSDFEISIIASGTHLFQSHGMTINEIYDDSLDVDAQIPFDLASDSPYELTTSAGPFIVNLTQYFEQIKPDAILILGDRFEMLPVAYVASMMAIKIIHLHGGEVTLGAIDNKMRFAISHLADLHLTATEQSKQRLIKAGISADNVFMTGALGVENALTMVKASRAEISKKTGIDFCDQNILFTFHPETLSDLSVDQQIVITLQALAKFNDLGKFISLPNADPGNHAIREKLIAFSENHANVHLTHNLGHYLYLSIMSEVHAVVGNSSSGIIEAPALGINTVNIGDRQKGREQAKTILQCGYNPEAIETALRQALSKRISSSVTHHPYYREGTCQIMVSVIKNYFL